MSQVPENPPDEKRELLAASQIDNNPKPVAKLRNPADLLTIGGSTYAPLAQLESEREKHVLPLNTTGLLGLGHVDLSSYKAEKLKIRTESIPTDIIDQMVSFPFLFRKQKK